MTQGLSKLSSEFAFDQTGAAAMGAQPLALPRWLVAVTDMLKRWGADIIFVGFLLGIAAWRWQVISSFPEPSGLDAGNWLAFGHALLGSDARSSTIVYPPVVPLLILGFAAIWGPLTGVQLLAMTSSLFPAIGAYILLRGRLGLRAVLLAGLLAPAVTTGEAAAWGGFPQLLGLGFLPMALWAMDRFVVSRGSKSWALAASLLLLLTVASSDLIGLAAAAICPLYLLIRISLIAEPDRPPRRSLVVGLLIGAVPSLTMIPIYAQLVSGALRTESKHLNQLTLATLQPSLDNLFKENVDFWHVVILAAIVSPLVLFIRRGRPLASIAASILLIALAELLIVRDVRFFYLLPLAMVVGLGAWWSVLTDPEHPLVWWRVIADFGRGRTISLDHVLTISMAVLLFVECTFGLKAYPQQIRWYSVLTPGMVQGLQRLDALAPRNSAIAVSPGPGLAATQAWPFGWWVEGLLDRPTYYASSQDWLTFADERTRAQIANQMFGNSAYESAAIKTARDHHITYIVVAKDWPGYWNWMSNEGTGLAQSVIIETDSIIVITTNG